MYKIPKNNVNHPCKVSQLSIKTLAEEVDPIVAEKIEFERQEKKLTEISGNFGLWVIQSQNGEPRLWC